MFTRPRKRHIWHKKSLEAVGNSCSIWLKSRREWMGRARDEVGQGHTVQRGA